MRRIGNGAGEPVRPLLCLERDRGGVSPSADSSSASQAGEIVASENAPTKAQVAIWLAMLAGGALLFLRGYRSYQIGAYQDDAAYVILARSLVHSDRYGMINTPGPPGEIQFPFGYPLLLSPFVLLFPENLDAMKALSIVATMQNASLLFWGWKLLVPGGSRWWALAVVGLYLFSPLTVDHARMVMSEPVFTTFCLTAILLAERLARGARGWWLYPALASVLVFVLFTRTIGVTLVGTVFGYLLWREGSGAWKELTLIAVGMVLLVGGIVAATPVRAVDILPKGYFKTESASFLVALLGCDGVTTEPDGTSEMGQTEPATETADGNPSRQTLLIDYMLLHGIEQHLGRDIRNVALPLGGGEGERTAARRVGLPFLPLLLGYSISALVIAGFVRWFRGAGRGLFLLFSALYCGALFLWAWSGPRMLYPVQPQIQLGMLLGMGAVVSWVASIALRHKTPGSLERRVILFVSLVLITSGVLKGSAIDDSRLHVGDLEARSNWLRSHAAASDIVMSEAPAIDFLYSGRKTVPYPSVDVSPGQLADHLARHGVKYVIVAPAVEWQSSYQPRLSRQTLQVLSLLEVLGTESRVALAYSSEQGLVQIFRVQG